MMMKMPMCATESKDLMSWTFCNRIDHIMYTVATSISCHSIGWLRQTSHSAHWWVYRCAFPQNSWNIFAKHFCSILNLQWEPMSPSLVVASTTETSETEDKCMRCDVKCVAMQRWIRNSALRFVFERREENHYKYVEWMASNSKSRQLRALNEINGSSSMCVCVCCAPSVADCISPMALIDRRNFSMAHLRRRLPVASQAKLHFVPAFG